jgi:hypothetical protein
MLEEPCWSWTCHTPCPRLDLATTPVFWVNRWTVFVSVINRSATDCSHAGRYSNLRFNRYRLRLLTLHCVCGWLDPGVGVTVRYRPFPLVFTNHSGLRDRGEVFKWISKKSWPSWSKDPCTIWVCDQSLKIVRGHWRPESTLPRCRFWAVNAQDAY